MWRASSRGIFSVVAIAAGSAFAACSSRVDIASSEQESTTDGGASGGASAGTGGATSETGGTEPGTGGVVPGPSGGRPETGGSSGGSGGSDHSHDPEACSAPPESGMCLAHFEAFYFDPASRTCKRFVYGGCGGNANRHSSAEECENTCLNDTIGTVAVIAARTCDGHGEQVSGPGTRDFTIQGSTVSRSETWGCGCPLRPEFVMAYHMDDEQRIELRLCHDEPADPCKANCSDTLEYHLPGIPPAEFVFPAP